MSFRVRGHATPSEESNARLGMGGTSQFMIYGVSTCVPVELLRRGLQIATYRRTAGGGTLSIRARPPSASRCGCLIGDTERGADTSDKVTLERLGHTVVRTFAAVSYAALLNKDMWVPKDTQT